MTDKPTTKKPDSKYKIGEDAARAQLDMLYAYYEIDFDELPKEGVYRAINDRVTEALVLMALERSGGVKLKAAIFGEGGL